MILNCDDKEEEEDEELSTKDMELNFAGHIETHVTPVFTIPYNESL